MEDKTCIYFIGSLKIGAVKIGRSDNPKKRLMALQTSSPYRLYLYGYIEDVTQRYELYLHKKFHNSRLEGEWFKLTDEIIQFMFYKANSYPEIFKPDLKYSKRLEYLIDYLEDFKDNPFILRELLNDDINLSKRSLGSYLKELCILGYLEHVGYNGNAKIYRHKEDDAV